MKNLTQKQKNSNYSVTGVINKKPDGFISLQNSQGYQLDENSPSLKELAFGDKVKCSKIKIKHKVKLIPKLISSRKIDFTLVILECVNSQWSGKGVLNGHPDLIRLQPNGRNLKEGDFAKVELLPALGGYHKVIEVYADDSTITDLAKFFCQVQDKPFSQQALKELEASINDDKLIEKLNDVSKQFITIDSEKTKDFDDAISVKRDKQGFEIDVAIADVAYYIKQGSLLDQAVQERARNMYINNEVSRMLHENLIKKCSLKAGSAKRCLVVSFRINHQGDLMGEVTLDRKVIKIHENLSDQEAENRIGNNNQMLKVLMQASDAISDNYFAHEKLIRSFNKEHCLGLIEPIMLMTNYLMAKRLNQSLSQVKGKFNPGIFRTLSIPTSKEWKKLIRGLNPPKNHGWENTLNRLLEKLSTLDDKDEIIKKLLAQLGKAQFSIKNSGHFRLGVDAYTYFTSPLRRYVDICVHRLLLSQDDTLTNKQLKVICNQANQAEKQQKMLDQFNVKSKCLDKLNELVDRNGSNKVLVKFSKISKVWLLNKKDERQENQVALGIIQGIFNANDDLEEIPGISWLNCINQGKIEQSDRIRQRQSSLNINITDGSDVYVCELVTDQFAGLNNQAKVKRLMLVSEY